MHVIITSELGVCGLQSEGAAGALQGRRAAPEEGSWANRYAFSKRGGTRHACCERITGATLESVELSCVIVCVCTMGVTDC